MEKFKFNQRSSKIVTSIIVMAAAAVLMSCETVKIIPSENHQESGIWETKAQAKDLATNKSYSFTAYFTALAPRYLRVDMTGPMGVSLASVGMMDNDLRYVLYRQKRYYRGHASDTSVEQLFKMKINPKVFMNICMDTPIKDEAWDCDISESGVLESCSNDADHVKIEWKDRNGDQKRVVITDKKTELELVFKNYAVFDEAKVGSEKNPFEINMPKGFTKYKIP